MKQENNRSVTRFQSYLVTGPEDSRRKQTQSLAKTLGIDLTRVSLDIFFISPQKSSVTIDQIRDLKNHIFQKPLKLNYKFILIEKAHKLTHEAQNALLKILEEPPSHAIIVLEAKDKSQLLPTIQSRIVIKQARPTDQPFETKRIKESNLLTEKNIVKLLEKIPVIDNPIQWLDDQIILLHKMLKKKISANQPAISPAKISDLIEKCAKTKQMIEANVNPRFALANLIFSISLTSK